MVKDKHKSKHSEHGKHKKPPLAPNKPKFKKTNNKKNNNVVVSVEEEATTPSQQLSFFLNHYQLTNKIQLSSLELDSIKGLLLFFSIYA